MAHPAIIDNDDVASSISLFERWVPVAMHQNHDPGVAVGIVHGGDLIWGRGYGLADTASDRPVTLDTGFRIASISKTFTATAILQLRDAGKLGLDDPVARHLNWFDLRYESSPQITIRNLLTHTAGLPRDSHTPMWTACAAPDWDEFVAGTRQRRLTRPPYDRFAYSNLGYALLGGIVTAVSGLSWSDYLRTHILAPLGMSETHPVPAEDDPNLATGYYRTQDDYSRPAAPFFLLDGFEAAANVASSVRDLARYAAFHLSTVDTPVLSACSLRDMHRAHWLDPDWKRAYGLGSRIFRMGEWEICGHDGSYNGYSSSLTLDRAHGFGVVVLTNSAATDARSYAIRAYSLILPAVIKATQPPQPRPDPAWERFIGDYESPWGTETVVIRGGRLQIHTLEAPDRPPAVLEPTDDPTVFTIQEEHESNETARFELDNDGIVVRLWVRNEYSDRVE
jgi:D-alanyl-D-alanine carboxypeptidase